MTPVRPFWSAERCFRIRPSLTWTRLGRPAFRPSVRTLYLDFETDLYDLGGRNPEIRGREIGVEVHRGEQGFSPDSHAGCFAGGDYHHPPEIICDVLRIDAAKFRLEAGELQPLHHVRCFHETEMEEDASDTSADRHQPDAVFRLDARLIGADGGDQQHTLVQDAIMPQMM